MFGATCSDSGVAPVISMVMFRVRIIPIKCEAVDLSFYIHAAIIAHKSRFFPAPRKISLRGSSELAKGMVLFLDGP